MKFIADTNLGKLVKWLRILGYDTAVYHGKADRSFLKKAEREGRVVLTRKKDMARRQFGGKLITVGSDHVQEQLSEVMKKLSITADADRLFSICVRCNAALAAVNKEDVAGMVPAFVYDTQTSFCRCPACGGVFWSGTHIDNVLNQLKTHIQRRHP